MVELSVENIVVDIDGNRILESISFSAKSGEIICVIGPNGSGKTTLLRTILGVIRPKAGDVRIGNRSIYSMSWKEKSAIFSYLPQDVPKVPFTVVELIIFGLNGVASHSSAVRCNSARVESILDSLEMRHLISRSITTISGGERKLAYVSMALSRDVDAYLFDEPTAHLDYRHAVEVMNLLRVLARRGKIVIFATHDLTLAARYADKFVLLNHGKLVGVGGLDDVFRPKLLRSVYGIEFYIIRKNGSVSAVVPK